MGAKLELEAKPTEEFGQLWSQVMDIMDSDKAEEFLDLLEQRLAEKVAEKEKETSQ